MLTENKANQQQQNQFLNLLTEYSVEDLTRCLIRQFCTQNKLTQTLSAFELQETKQKKINKSTLIRILSLNNLVYHNKQASKPFKSLLEILVSYLKNKFKKQLDSRRNQGVSEGNMHGKQRQKWMKNDLSIAQSLSTQNKKEEECGEYEDEWEKQEQGNDPKLIKSVNDGRTQPVIAKTSTSQNLYHTTQFQKLKHQPIEQQHQQQHQINGINCVQIDSDTIEQKPEQKIEPITKNIEKLSEKTKVEKLSPKTLQSSLNTKQQVKQQKNHAKRPQSAIVGKEEEQNKGGSRMMGMKRFGKKKEEVFDLKIEETNKDPIQKNPTKNQPSKQPQPQIPTQSIKPTEIKTHTPPNQQENDGPKMVKIFGKKKKRQQESSQLTKFKFDENFVDKPLNSVTQKYQYEPLDMFKITVQGEVRGYQIDYRAKPNLTGSKRLEKQKAITQQQATALKKALFQGGLAALPKSWHQGFILSPFKQTPYGLKQIQGGPCGIIAAVQCYFLKHYLHLAQLKPTQTQNQLIRDNCLIAALTDMLFKSRNQQQKVILALPPKGFSGNKIDYSGLKLQILDAKSFEVLYDAMCGFRSYFVGKSNHGVTVLMICMIMTKGIQKIKSQIDMAESPLIGNHGHCTQELVNLFITGTASSNCFDGQKILGQDMIIKGIQQKSQFGFLTIFQTLKYIQVGKHLKNPIYPFWIICKQFHYHVIFANHYLIAENNDVQKFDIAYFDGLYNCGDRIVITLERVGYGETVEKKDKDLPLIEQVMMTKWGKRKSNWNGSIPIL